MFKLLRLAVYGLVGYALYQFIADVLRAADEARESSHAPRSKSKSSGTAKLTGKRKGSGKVVATHDVDGGSTRHRTGRGVI